MTELEDLYVLCSNTTSLRVSCFNNITKLLNKTENSNIPDQNLEKYRNLTKKLEKEIVSSCSLIMILSADYGYLKGTNITGKEVVNFFVLRNAKLSTSLGCETLKLLYILTMKSKGACLFFGIQINQNFFVFFGIIINPNFLSLFCLFGVFKLTQTFW